MLVSAAGKDTLSFRDREFLNQRRATMSTPTPIEIKIDGKTYKGSYSVDGHMLTTRYHSQAMKLFMI